MMRIADVALVATNIRPIRLDGRVDWGHDVGMRRSCCPPLRHILHGFQRSVGHHLVSVTARKRDFFDPVPRFIGNCTPPNTKDPCHLPGEKLVSVPQRT